ncbi:NAD(P)/FAD-dependent oxidoreductase [Oceanibium sediminis]|uniref:NAD(P)/FAD-dependent oxidoreductase n=1 Tax=Oceanibium sediminis TaxID=2026339 RepID=UPI000DD36A80|nr:FAD-binding oxidoreductase [Oceanibium sediminis]
MPSTIVIGTGIIGIATAYYLARTHGHTDITLVDRDQPMAFTSAQSGENYRNWWSHPAMVAFTNRSIDLMEEIARDSGNRINMNRRGYALATRAKDIDPLVAQLHAGFEDQAEALIRFHDGTGSAAYHGFEKPDWEGVPDGVDILQDRALIAKHFPGYDPEVRAIVHVRRGGDISGQQLGMYMLEYLKQNGLTRITGEVSDIQAGDGYRVRIETADGPLDARADQLVNAAGPFAGRIAAMLGVELPVQNVMHQKIAFEDREGAVPRALPFSIDLDPQTIDWTDEERELLLQDEDVAWMAREMPGAIHCRPDGGDKGSWIKLGWAYNESATEADWQVTLDDNFPDIVLRGASRLTPALKTYIGQLPRNMHHYGGYYTMTKENWPLIGPMGPEGAYMNCALSGYGTMAACAAGELCAAWIAGSEKPAYAEGFSLARYGDEALMTSIREAGKGLL